MTTLLANPVPANDSPAILHVGQTTIVGGWRIHRFASVLRATELANAGKRGKRCAEWTVGDHSARCAPFESMALEMIAAARRGHMTRTMGEMRDAGFTVESQELRGVDVVPVHEAVRIVGMHVVVDADLDGFTVRNADDPINETTAMGRTKSATRRFYAWASANREALRGMLFGDVYEACRGQGIELHTWCAMD